MEWLFPFYCLGCQQQGVTVCRQCLKRIKPFQNNLTCCYCQRATEFGLSCEGCGPLDGLWAIFEYEKKGLLSEILHNWKYNQIEGFWDDFKEEVSLQLELRVWLKENFDLVSWIPLSKNKLQLRCFNQSELIARQLNPGLDMKQIIHKIADTKAQMTLLKAERLNNLKDVFKVIEDGKGRRIILVDDISTTKATLEEAAKTLKAAGWQKVYGLVLARQTSRDGL